jgi:hypothetical protein
VAEKYPSSKATENLSRQLPLSILLNKKFRPGKATSLVQPVQPLVATARFT